MGFGGGWGGGGPMFGGGSRSGASGAGLPFGGIPYELQAGVDRLLTEEPEPDDAVATFSQQASADERRPLSLRRMLAPYPGWMWTSVLLVLVSGVLLQAGPELTRIAIDDGMLPPHRRLGVVVVVSVVYLASVGATGLVQRAQVRVTGRLAAGVMHDLRVRVFTHLQRLSLDFFTEEKAGVVMTRMTSDIENLQQLLQDGMAQLALQSLTMVVIIGVLLVTNVRLALVTLALVLPGLIVLSAWFRRVSAHAYDRVRDGIAAVLGDLSESLQGVRVVVANNRQRRNIARHRSIVGAYRDANVQTARANAVYGPGTQLVGTLSQAALLAIGGHMVARHQLTIGELVAFFLYLGRFFQPIQLLVQQYNTYQQGQASVVKLRNLLDTAPSVVEDPTAVDLPPAAGAIELDAVSFGYDPAVPVLHHVDLRIAPGETVALVGPTGAGKSTVAKLLTRFYDPGTGAVLLDGHDLRSVTLSSLRRQIGLVPQEPFLFAGTVRDNIAFAKPEASDGEVGEAVRTVGLGPLLDRLPSGIDTVVHERGQSLSSGERQLVALARAFLAGPRVLVLDEATSNLDLQSETAIEAALDVLLAGRTAVLIAHRLSTAQRADRIVVVDDGRVVEVGTHDELVAAGGRYARMHATWAAAV